VICARYEYRGRNAGQSPDQFLGALANRMVNQRGG
jgi:hypothetical protein